MGMFRSVVTALVAVLLLAGCSSVSRTVHEGAEAVGVPPSCIKVYTAGEGLLDLVLDLQDQALASSDQVFEFTEALASMDADAVEALATKVVSRARASDVERVRTLVADYRSGMAECRAA